VFDSIAADAVTPTIRQTVEAIDASEEVSEVELGRRLGISRSTVSYRVGRAVRAGWLLNRETRRGHSARVARGAALPAAVSALPSVEELRQVFEGSNGFGDQSPPSPPDASATPEDQWTVR
jgi:hypothetical protein